MASVVAGKCCSFNRFKGVFSYRIVSRVAGVVLAPTRLKSYSVYMQQEKREILKIEPLFFLLRRKDSNLRPLGYEPNELPLLHSAISCLAVQR